MLRHPHPRLLAAAALAAVLLSGTTVAAAASPTPVTGTKPMLNEVVHTETVTCTTQDSMGTTDVYTGTADIEVTMSDTTFTVKVLRYRMTDPEENTGNKSNINLEAHTRPFGSSRSFEWSKVWSKAGSPDAMIQDGLWHDLALSTSVARGTRTTDSYGGSVQFVFDEDMSRSGPTHDPRCTATLSSSLTLPAASGPYSPIVSSPTGQAQECVVPAWKGTPCWMYGGPGSIVVDVRSTTGSAAVYVRRQGETKLYNLAADKDYRFELSFGDSISGVGQPDPETLQVKVPGGALPE